MSSVPNATVVSATAPAPAPAEASPPRPRWRGKWLLLVSVGCYALFWWLGGRMGIAEERGYDGSLLLADGALGNVIAAAALVIGAVVLGTLLAGAVRPDAGLFAAAVGLLALSNRGRSVAAVLHDADGARGTYLTLSLELLVLFAILGCAWYGLFVLRGSGRLQPDSARDGLVEEAKQPSSTGWSAVLTHVAIMAAVLILLSQSEDKKQAVAAVAIGSFAGAFFPYWQRGAYPSAWYLAAPLMVGLLGYLLAFALVPPADMAIGRPGNSGGVLAALARPLPLDYASVGTAGALGGYWMRRKTVREREVAATPES